MMKPEEVIDLLKIQREDCSASVLREDDIDYAIAALEKQVPKRPIYQGAQFEEEPTCPSCFRTLDEEVDINGCQMCLQRLDWGNEE